MRRRANARVLALVVLLSAALGACADDDDRTPRRSDLDAIDLDVDATVSIDESGFDPDELRVTAGDVLEVENRGEEPHSFTDEERELDVTILPGETTTIVLEETGEKVFHDRVDGHEITITVDPLPAADD